MYQRYNRGKQCECFQDERFDGELFKFVKEATGHKTSKMHGSVYTTRFSFFIHNFTNFQCSRDRDEVHHGRRQTSANEIMRKVELFALPEFVRHFYRNHPRKFVRSEV